MNLQVNVQEIILFGNIKEQSKAKTEREKWSQKKKQIQHLVGC
jgi:hypothetical protein